MRFWLLAILLAASSASAEGLNDPHADYLLYCRGCHLHTGDAVPDANVPSLHELAPLLESSEGREYIVRVPGVSQTPMSDERLAAVLNWVVKTFNSDKLPADHKPYTAREVARARQKVLTDPLKTRAEILGDS
jgi:hypothetical protein